MGRRNKGKSMKGASPADALPAYMENEDGAEAMAVEGELSGPVIAAPEPLIAAIRIDGEEVATGSDQTSADYYFDSYAHFGEHEFTETSLCLFLCVSVSVEQILPGLFRLRLLHHHPFFPYFHPDNQELFSFALFL